MMTGTALKENELWQDRYTLDLTFQLTWPPNPWKRSSWPALIGRLKKGTNETTKAIERGVAKLVVVGEDVEPPEIVAHIPPLCEEKKTPYIYVKKQSEIGAACGMRVKSAAVAILEPGKGKDILDEIVQKAQALK